MLNQKNITRNIFILLLSIPQHIKLISLEILISNRHHHQFNVKVKKNKTYFIPFIQCPQTAIIFSLFFCEFIFPFTCHMKINRTQHDSITTLFVCTTMPLWTWRTKIHLSHTVCHELKKPLSGLKTTTTSTRQL